MTCLLLNHVWEQCLDESELSKYVDVKGPMERNKLSGLFRGGQIEETHRLMSSSVRSRSNFPPTVPALLTRMVGCPTCRSGFVRFELGVGD